VARAPTNACLEIEPARPSPPHHTGSKSSGSRRWANSAAARCKQPVVVCVCTCSDSDNDARIASRCFFAHAQSKVLGVDSCNKNKCGKNLSGLCAQQHFTVGRDVEEGHEIVNLCFFGGLQMFRSVVHMRVVNRTCVHAHVHAHTRQTKRARC